MAHKTFISYKYSESRDIRDRIIGELGSDAVYYKGERSDSPDLADLATETIKGHLKNMLFETTVTIVVLSPNMRQSEWMDWEIRYSLRQETRGDSICPTNGLVCVLGEFFGGYDWLRFTRSHSDGCESTGYNSRLLLDIVNANRGNQIPKEYTCERCKTIDPVWGSYASIVPEMEFLQSPARYIDQAFQKRQKQSNYKICKDPR